MHKSTKELQEELMGYENFIERELNTLLNDKEVIDIHFDPNDKKVLFNLGVAFAAGKRINITNYRDLNKTEGKSFMNMILYWYENNLSLQLTVDSYDHNIFLICPVRMATGPQKEIMNKYVMDSKNQGYSVYYPATDTDQIDSIGYRICTDNARAIARAGEVSIYYDPTSKGSVFDLGVTAYLQTIDSERRFVLLNESEMMLSVDDYGDNIVHGLMTFNDITNDKKILIKKSNQNI